MHFETNLLWQTHLGPNLTKLQGKPIIDVLESLVAQLTIILLAVEVLGWGSPGRANPGGQKTATLPMSSWQSPWVMKNTFLSWGWTRRTFQSFPEPHGSCWVEKLEDKMEKFGDQKKKKFGDLKEKFGNQKVCGVFRAAEGRSQRHFPGVEGDSGPFPGGMKNSGSWDREEEWQRWCQISWGEWKLQQHHRKKKKI